MNRNLKSFFVSVCALCLFAAVIGSEDARGETPEQKLQRGRELISGEKHEEGRRILHEAAAAFEEKCQAQPDDSESHKALGKAYFYLDEDAKALKAFAKASTLSPKDPEPRFFRGLIFGIQGDFEKAVEEITLACELGPDDPDYWFERGRFLHLQDKFSEALAAYGKAIDLDDSHEAALYRTAVVLTELGRDTEALRYFEKALEADPKNPNAAFNAGIIHQKLGRHNEALANFKTVIELDPTDWHAIAKTVQEYQALKDRKNRDRARTRLLKLKKKGAIESLASTELYCRDQFVAGRDAIMAFEFFELKGDRARRYVFYVRDKKSGKTKYRLSVGSYETTNLVARESGEIAEEDRLFHLDGYFPGGEHRTYVFFKSEPSYDEVRALVVEILQGTRKHTSRFKPTPAGDQDEK